ncbi:SDR family NAD(P)-dependent oxidoreductase [Romeria aff. gracilis LEGE 07310]|uniref:SDR family NAD(P)-dependent oxidoreductase n=1 Tax=Vasconcelosia minhoensis LEGE 07310 TaxID=915328 RepID=A0A8J7A898_9CYAN|nr:SDR family NAD(P)-dependent oxidoreductase [Romeria gracilis]MBE9077920.1 SDR family NAD(P)-dependent oxidoreductase [Romeria aff. gracilis LEGE 07310]
MHIQGKTALVTGASRGIGRAIALELARQGMQRIVLIARSYPALAEVAAEVEALGVEAVLLPLDLTQSQQVSIAIARVWKRYGPIHLLVNCAGVAHQAPFLRSQLSQVQAEIDTNLLGLYGVTRLVARRMAVQRQGKIVNVSSLMGKIAAPTMATYSATKFAILGFTQALRCELADYNVQVSALLPTLTDTDMVRDFDWFRGVAPVSSQQVARALVRGLRQNSTEIVVGWQGHLAVWCDRVAPWLTEKVLRLAAPPRLKADRYLELHPTKL